MTPEQLSDAIEDYQNLVERYEKLQKRFIQIAGKDTEQEIAITQRLESMEKVLDLIDYAMDSEDVLSARENLALFYRLDGLTYEAIGEALFVTHQSAHNYVKNAIKKMVKIARELRLA